MKPKPLVPRALAQRDVEGILAHYLLEGDKLAVNFANAVEHAYARIARFPAVGSTRYSLELGMPGLRSWALPRLPYVIFYIELADHIEILRVLHGSRDLPAWLRSSD